MCGSTNSLTPIEQASTTDLCNMVLHGPVRGGGSLQAPSVRLRGFTEDSVSKDSESESSRRNSASPSQSPRSPHCYSVCYHHCPNSWADQCETEYKENKKNEEDYTERSSEDEDDDQADDEDEDSKEEPPQDLLPP